MTRKTATRLAWTLWTVGVLLGVLSIFFLVISRSTPPPPKSFGFRGFSAIFALSFGTVGALIASRKPENSIGWIFIGMGVLSGFQELAQQYAIYAVSAHPAHPLAFGITAAWFPAWIWIPATSGVMYLFPLFPSGHLPSRRWRALLAIGTVGAVVASFGYGFSKGPLNNFSTVTNPLGIVPPGFIVVGNVGQATYGLVVILGALSLFERFRRAGGEERAQIKWLAFSGVFLAVAFFVTLVGSLKTLASPGIVSSLLVILAFIAVPISVGVAILKYRLFDIDVVINKAVVYGVLALFISAAYIGIVVGVGAVVGQGDKPNVALSIAATAVVALAFQPLRTRVQRFANRLVYGKRATPYEVMSGFSHRMAGTVSLDQLLPQMAEAAAQGVGASASRVRLFLPGEGVRLVSWPQDSTAAEFDRIISVSYQGSDVGELAVAKPAGEPLAPAEIKLLDDLAAQAGLAMHNARLTAELQVRLEEISRQAQEIRVSRQRIVAARDAALRQLERDIHGGTQQQLLAIRARIRSSADLMERDPGAAAAMLDELSVDANDALEALRDLARGIFPPLLADKGLVAALEAHINKTKLPAMLRAEGKIGRYDAGVEAAIYFCCIEAMQNASKYAEDSPILVALAAGRETLSFEVSDEGPGFDPEAVSHRSGLAQMADRVEALGGDLSVTSAPGHGTTISGQVPAVMKEPAL